MDGSGYKSIGEIIQGGYSFFIPRYQRGYRWTTEHVRFLLEDIYEDKLLTEEDLKNIKDAIPGERSDIFEEWYSTKKREFFAENSQIEEKKRTRISLQLARQPYCIQPLVVCKNSSKGEPNEYVVIDGQQRLTSIAIILKALDRIKSEFSIYEDDGFIVPQINFEYEARNNCKTYLKSLVDVDNQKNPENIDCEYIKENYRVVFQWFKNHFDAVKESGLGNESKQKYFEYLYYILHTLTRFIWYPVKADSSNQRTVFENFNTGKLSLTNSELIKALFMDGANYDTNTIDDKRIVISEKWDEIVNALNEPDFWTFVPHPNQYEDGEFETRIDVIFELFIMEHIIEKRQKTDPNYTVERYKEDRSNSNDERYLYYRYEEWIREELNTSEDKTKVMKDCWQQVRKTFLGLRELYQDDLTTNNVANNNQNINRNQLYNLTGLYIRLANMEKGVDSITKEKWVYLKVYHNIAEVLKKDRDKRKEALLALVKKELMGEHDSMSIEEYVKSIRHTYSTEKDVIIESKEIVSLLITYNLAIINTSGGLGERFNFRAISSGVEKWEREHIFANKVNVDELNKDDDSEEKQEHILREERAAVEELGGFDYLDYVLCMYYKMPASVFEIKPESEEFKQYCEEYQKTISNAPSDYSDLLNSGDYGHLKYEEQDNQKNDDRNQLCWLRNRWREAIESDRFADDLNGILKNNSKECKEYMMKRVIDTRMRCNKTLNPLSEVELSLKQRFELMDLINISENSDDVNVKRSLLYGVLKRHKMQFRTQDFIDLTGEAEKITAKCCGEDNKGGYIKADLFGVGYQYRPQKGLNINSSEDIENALILLKDSQNGAFRNYWQDEIRDKYMKTKQGVSSTEAKVDDYELRSMDEISNPDWDFLYKVFELCKNTQIKIIDAFFNKRANKRVIEQSAEETAESDENKVQTPFIQLLYDNTMGNMTLLTGGKGGQNPSVGDMPYRQKKRMILDYFKAGEIVVLGTLLVFSDAYNDSEDATDFWLPNNRMRYITHMISTLTKFFNGGN